MALINCPDCGTEVSDAAPACPKCGRPIATVPSPANVSGERARSHATVTVTLSSFVLIVLAIAAAVWFVPSMEIGQNLEARCQVNGMGDGSCQFTNTGWTPGAQCVDVSLRNKQGSAAHSGAVCSGRVWPNDTVQKNVMIAIGNTCDNALGVPDLSDVCTMDVNNADSGDAGAGPPSGVGATQPSTDATVGNPQASAGDTAAVVPPADSTSAAALSDPPETSISPASESSSAAATATAANVSDQDQPAMSASSVVQAAAGAPGESASSPASPASGASVSEALQAVIANAAGPSFDCSKATSATELAICGNADLSELDRGMAIDYSRTNYATDETVRDAQRAWLRVRNACGADVICLREQYAARIHQLQQ